MKKQPHSQVLTTQQITTVSPLPPATEFSGYEKVLSGAANRILTVMEKEQDARLKFNERDQDYQISSHAKSIEDQLKNNQIQRECNIIAVKTNRYYVLLQTVLPFILCVFFVVIGTYCLLKQYTFAGNGLIWSSLTMIVSSYVKKEFFNVKKQDNNN